jgi:hypothetical protein
VGGAGKWKDDYVSQLMAAGVESVVIVPDNDEPGRQHAEAVALSCHAAGLKVRIVALPDVPAKGDVSDYLTNHTLEALLALVTAAPLYPPAQAERIVAPGTAQVDFSVTLDSLVAFIRRYVVLSDDALTAIVMWVAHTYVFNAAECTPYLVVSSATKRAGKTRLFEVLEQLVPRPWYTGRVSAAALLRKIDAVTPTLLLDESDAAFKFHSEYTEAVRGLLDSGYRKGGRHSLCIGQGANLSARDFNTFCPKAFAGIGDVLPDTVNDRSIPIQLRRRTAGERVERFRLRKVPTLANPLREALTQWATAVTDVVAVAEPSLPDALNDRAQDVWEPLFAIADLVGGAWPIRVRSAAIALAGQQPDDNDTAVELLKDVRSIFAERPEDDAIRSTDLLAKLNALTDRPWPTFSRGDKPLNGHGLARLLKPFGITSAGTLRFGTGTAKGYRRGGFDDAFARYLGSEESHRNNVNENGPEVAETKCHTAAECDASEMQASSTNTGLGDDVTVQSPDLEDVQKHDHAHAEAEEWEQAW